MVQMKEQPICRVNTLEMAKHYLLNSDALGLCIAISMALQNYGIYPVDWDDLSIYFPKFKRIYALRFGGFGWYYWWRPGWRRGRILFLNWLIRQYSDDDTNLRDIEKEIINGKNIGKNGLWKYY